MDYKAPSFPINIFSDERGSLIPFEALKTIPIEMKRVYFIHGMPKGIKRGAHAHFKTKQVIFCISGSCRMLFDDGVTKSYKTVDTTKSILIDTMIWHEMDEFSEDCIICVFADHYFDKSDYITDYNEFIRLVK